MVAYQSLYRRYRSQRFSELRGQSHVTDALKAAVANDRVGHAYLFSGPRGTGKTSTARILAKALNCANLGDDGEPCCECESCVAIQNGKSFDVHELDAASNNKVDDIRDLISKVHLGSPGKTKVYILDEVHMLSAGAENALLKTLEEPPEHVIFVLATTEPHKVVQTIRSRTQPFEFHLLPADELAEHVRYVIEDAELDISEDKVEEAIDYVLRQGGGSARDTLSALDLVAAAGGIPAGSDVGYNLANAIGDGNPEAAIAALQEGLTNGQEPRVIGEITVDVLREAFLAVMGASLEHLNDTAQQQAQDLGKKLGAGTLTRSLETIGSALVEMRQAPDPRVPLEVALLRLCRSVRPSSDDGGGGSGSGADSALVDALTQRIAALEQQVAGLTAQLAGGAPVAAAPTNAAPTTPAAVEPSEPTGPAAAARGRLAEVTGKAPRSPRSRRPGSSPPLSATSNEAAETSTEPASEPGSEPAAAEPAPAPSATGRALTQGEATQALESVLGNISQRARVRFQVGRVIGVDGSAIIFAVPNDHYVERCKGVQSEVEEGLAAHFQQPVHLSVVVDDAGPPPSLDPAKIASAPKPPQDDSIDDIGPVEDLVDAPDQSLDGVDRLTKAFPGSKVIEPKPE